jgi:hypothetical protein
LNNYVSPAKLVKMEVLEIEMVDGQEIARSRKNSTVVEKDLEQVEVEETRTLVKKKKFKVKAPVSYAKQMETVKKETAAAMKKLIIVTSISMVFIAAQLYGGYASGSIAVYTDAAHMSADIFGFAISMIALKLA